MHSTIIYFIAAVAALFSAVTPLAASGFVLDAQAETELSGLWQFYPHELLTGFDIALEDSAPTRAAYSVQVPADWNNYPLKDARFGAHGAGTFSTWLENLQVGELYAIRLNFAGSAHRIFVGDAAQPLCAAGKPALSAAEYEPEYRHVLCRFSATAARMRLTIQVANFLHAAGGLRDAPIVGKAEQVWRGYLVRAALAVAALAILLAVSVLLVAGYVFNRQEYRNLYLLGIALVLDIYRLNSDILIGRELWQFYGFVPQAKLNLFFLPFGAAMLLLYLQSWLGSAARKSVMVLRYAACGLIVWSLFLLLAPLGLTMSAYFVDLYATMVFAVGFTGFALLTLFRQEQTLPRLLAAGLSLFLLSVISAVLNILHLWDIRGLEFLGMLLFLVTQTGQNLVELNRLRREQRQLIRADREALDRLQLFVPRRHLEKISPKLRTPLAPGQFYETEVCILFLRVEPASADAMDTQSLFDLDADLAEEVANFTRQAGGVVDRISVGRFILSFPDDPAVALRLAVDLRVKVRDWAALLGRYILFRAGIHYGPAVWGLYGSAERWAGGYMGDTVNVAARLETLCARYKTGILMSQDAYFRSAHLDEYLVRMLEPVKLKGRKEHTFVYEVLSGLPEERLKRVQATLPAFGRGLQAFLNKNVAQAIDYFEQTLAQNPDDFAAQLYLERAKKLAAQGVDDDWNPIEALRKK
jgi:class 3 adenylate cyclase